MNIERGATVHGYTFLHAKPKPAPAPAPRQLTVGELIELLKAHSPDLPVWAEGCGCSGEAFSVGVSDFGKGPCLDIRMER